MKIGIVLTGRGYHVAESIPTELDLDENASLSDALAAIADVLPEGEALPPSCLISFRGQHVGTISNHDNVSLVDGGELMLIAPVAGG